MANHRVDEMGRRGARSPMTTQCKTVESVVWESNRLEACHG